ncbi:hypothetical protein [Mycobacterium sp. E740]|uniref:DUF7155 family protein n=1 Tax=Mycobacterium sp. E740 TaxID=1834149 RepID=UPI0007FD3C03|nr:hypothetical protein [Mycobacterium sp. E740]OBI80258.1 hypothetical protein A5663_17785 [Mycobacterium sp. E740]
MTSTDNRARRVVAAGVFAVAAVAAPLTASVLATSASDALAGPACLAWFGNKEDGKCLSYSEGNGINVGSPQVGLNQGGPGISTGPLLPGQTITDPYR